MATTTAEAPAKHHDTETAASEPMEVRAILAEFDHPDDVLHAAEKVRDAGYKRWDVHSPFPVHGMDQAMGVKRTILPLIVFSAGLAGVSLALLLQWWTNAHDYPFMISGKPMFSLPANVPVMFEVMVLLSALTSVFGMFMLNDLPRHYNPIFKSDRFLRVTDDRFFIIIDARDPKFSEVQTWEFLGSLHPIAIEKVED